MHYLLPPTGMEEYLIANYFIFNRLSANGQLPSAHLTICHSTLRLISASVLGSFEPLFLFGIQQHLTKGQSHLLRQCEVGIDRVTMLARSSSEGLSGVCGGTCVSMRLP